MRGVFESAVWKTSREKTCELGSRRYCRNEHTDLEPALPLYAAIVPTRYLRTLLEHLRKAAPACFERALQAAGINETALQQPQHVLRQEQIEALFEATAAYLQRTDLAFEMGRLIKIDHHLALGVALRQCKTTDALLRLLVRYSRLITPSISSYYQRKDDHGEYVLRPSAAMSQKLLYYFEEIYAVSFHTDLKAILQTRMRPLDVYLSMPAPPHVARYAQLQPSRFHFAALALPEVRIIIPGEVLDAPLIQPKPQGQQPSEHELLSLQRNTARSDTCSDWVKLILNEAEGCQPSRTELAQLLNVSEPTLTRYLKKEGYCLRELGKQIRHQRACAMLADPQQPISQIAYRLGYGDVANFSHAFRSTAGASPREYRQQLRNEPSLR